MVLCTGWLCLCGEQVGMGGGVLAASHPLLQRPFLEGRSCLDSFFHVVPLDSVSLLRWQTEVPAHDDCEKPFGHAELQNVLWLAWVVAGWCLGCFC